MIENKHPKKLDVRQAALSSLQISGQDSLSNYERLMQETLGNGGENTLNWTAHASLRQNFAGLDEAWLHLTVSTTLPQVCQRCLGPVDLSVQIDREFRFVDTEAAAEQEDDESEEDVLVISREFDLAGLIEDEVLMDLPLVPRHDICPVPVKLATADVDFEDAPKKPNPFAALAQLKGKDST
jgi:uncharacterized protein